MVVGIGVCDYGCTCDFASLSFTQSVVMPVGSRLAANVFFAHFWLGEKLGTTDIIGTSFIVGGAVLIAVAYGALGDTAVSEHVFYDADDLVELYHRWVVSSTVLQCWLFWEDFHVMKKLNDL